MYYDGFANQEQPIKLTVSKALQPNGIAKHDQTGKVQQKGTTASDGLVPPLEHVLHTKWPEATVHWSGCEPILQLGMLSMLDVACAFVNTYSQLQRLQTSVCTLAI